MLSHLETLTAMEALMVALSGFVLIFIVLGCLALLIQINAKVIGSIEASQKAKAPVAVPVAAPSAAPVANAQDDEELVAVLMAAIAEETQCDPGSFQITSVVEKR